MQRIFGANGDKILNIQISTSKEINCVENVSINKNAF